MRLQIGVQLIQHQARLYRHPPAFDVQGNNTCESLADIQHQGFAHGLAALRGAAASGQNGNALVPRDLDGAHHVRFVMGHHHANGFDLIDRGIG